MSSASHVPKTPVYMPQPMIDGPKRLAMSKLQQKVCMIKDDLVESDAWYPKCPPISFLDGGSAARSQAHQFLGIRFTKPPCVVILCRSMRYQTSSNAGMRSERNMENSRPGPLVPGAALSAAFPQHPPV